MAAAVLAAAVFGGCTGPTTPNPSLITLPHLRQRIDAYASNLEGQAHGVLLELAQRNRLLAVELGRLPGLRHDVTAQKLRALERIAQFQKRHPHRVAQGFKRMYQEGKPKVRRFCSPLQAVFWLALEREFSEDDNPFFPYELKRLLDRAWVVRRGPGLTTRWRNFFDAADRLNSPRLIDYFERNWLEHQDYPGTGKSVEEVYYSGAANSPDATALSVFLLQRAGYQAHALLVETSHRGHVITVFKDRGKYFVMDNGLGRGRRRGILGPFDHEHQIPYVPYRGGRMTF